MGIGKRRSGPAIPGVGVTRAYAPSGPWVDAFGNPARSPNASYTPPIAVAKIKDGNPDPSNWKILKAQEHGKFLILMMEYPDCTNYEGKKILVFEDVTMIDLVNQKMIDPHFFPKNPKFKSPIARFEPTDRGWKMAEKFVRAL